MKLIHYSSTLQPIAGGLSYWLADSKMNDSICEPTKGLS